MENPNGFVAPRKGCLTLIDNAIPSVGPAPVARNCGLGRWWMVKCKHAGAQSREI